MSGASGSNTAEKISKLVENFNFSSDDIVQSPKKESTKKNETTESVAASEHMLNKLKTDSLDAETLLYGKCKLTYVCMPLFYRRLTQNSF